MKEIYNKIIRFQNLEKKYGFEDGNWWYRIPANCRILYHEARTAYICRLFFATILTIASSIEVFFVNKIPFEYFTEVEIPYRRGKLDSNKLHKQLTLYSLSFIAKEKGLIEEKLYEEITLLRTVRNNIVHSKTHFDTGMFRFRLNKFSGKGIKSRGGGFISPLIDPKDGSVKAIQDLPIDKEAENSLILFLRIVREFQSSN